MKSTNYIKDVFGIKRTHCVAPTTKPDESHYKDGYIINCQKTKQLKVIG